jgi:hypothetical protein
MLPGYTARPVPVSVPAPAPACADLAEYFPEVRRAGRLLAAYALVPNLTPYSMTSAQGWQDGH